MYATSTFGSRVDASPGVEATCPSCDARVVPKCGEVMTWHFAHVRLEDCDTWSEGESAWHVGWKERWPADCRERVLGANREHRADVYSGGYVVELQHSSISASEIVERETFYEKHAAMGMVWLFDAIEPYRSGRLEVVPEGPEGAPVHHNFRWGAARKTILAAKHPIYFDLGGGELLMVRKIHKEDGKRTRGWGNKIHAEDFVSRFSARAPSRPATATMSLPPSLFGAL